MINSSVVKTVSMSGNIKCEVFENNKYNDISLSNEFGDVINIQFNYFHIKSGLNVHIPEELKNLDKVSSRGVSVIPIYHNHEHNNDIDPLFWGEGKGVSILVMAQEKSWLISANSWSSVLGYNVSVALNGDNVWSTLL